MSMLYLNVVSTNINYDFKSYMKVHPHSLTHEYSYILVENVCFLLLKLVVNGLVAEDMPNQSFKAQSF